MDPLVRRDRAKCRFRRPARPWSRVDHGYPGSADWAARQSKPSRQYLASLRTSASGTPVRPGGGFRGEGRVRARPRCPGWTARGAARTRRRRRGGGRSGRRAAGRGRRPAPAMGRRPAGRSAIRFRPGPPGHSRLPCPPRRSTRGPPAGPGPPTIRPRSSRGWQTRPPVRRRWRRTTPAPRTGPARPPAARRCGRRRAARGAR